MTNKSILDELLSAGRGMASKGEDYAAGKLGVGGAQTERGAMLKGAAGGALAAGALTLLLGSGAGRGVLKLGGLAALGGLAYNAYKNYADKKQDSGAPLQIEAKEEHQIVNLSDAAAEKRSRALLAAMISAAKADGHIDDSERQIIETRMRGLEGLDSAFVKAELAKPVNPQEIAALADGPQAASEIYALSALVVEVDHPAERLYLNDLAAALKLDPELAREIESATAKV
ncbi:tellurite resistance TerB family protein [Neomegalonema perideroedes]|uniref:tellurite resistance TerB family protein n=1 Tax=Neomegalonema perideroedes TaxID=217219 RepID=UPI00037D51EA|nr:tellurite resistance TerB family protein [Neomegalonema perideroedes]